MSSFNLVSLRFVSLDPKNWLWFQCFFCCFSDFSLIDTCSHFLISLPLLKVLWKFPKCYLSSVPHIWISFHFHPVQNTSKFPFDFFLTLTLFRNILFSLLITWNFLRDQVLISNLIPFLQRTYLNPFTLIETCFMAKSIFSVGNIPCAFEKNLCSGLVE